MQLFESNTISCNFQSILLLINLNETFDWCMTFISCKLRETCAQIIGWECLPVDQGISNR